jgi:nucleoside-diphosphate-sugar epimerase
VPWSEEKRRREYSRLGAYEASKMESDAVVQAMALDLGIALTVVNPASVIGDSVTGESPQVLGLATTVRDLWDGRLAAIPGDRSTFLPVVTVDYLAGFIALVPTVEETRGQSYWVLDDGTPPLGELLTLVGEHLGVRVPRLRIPVGLVRSLPSWLTRADPETLSFLSSDRYPAGPAIELARGRGLHLPDVRVALKRWADHIVTNK